MFKGLIAYMARTTCHVVCSERVVCSREICWGAVVKRCLRLQG